MSHRTPEAVAPPPEHAPRHYSVGRIALGGAAVILITVGVADALVTYSHNSAQNATPSGAITSEGNFSATVNAPPGLIPASPSKTPTPTASPSINPEKLPYGKPLSYTMTTKQAGVIKQDLLEMSCPKDCTYTPIDAQTVERNLVPPEPTNIDDHTSPIWNHVYYFHETDPVLLAQNGGRNDFEFLTHNTHYPQYANNFPGSKYKQIQVGDKMALVLSEDPSTGVTKVERDYVAVLNEDLSKDTSNNKFLWSQRQHGLKSNQITTTTCVTPGDGFNTVITWQEVSSKVLGYVHVAPPTGMGQMANPTNNY